MSPTRINVLHLVLSVRPGGRRNAILSLARRSRTSVGRCDLCCLDELGCDYQEISEHFDSVTVLGRGPSGHLGMARRLRILCRDRDINLIHSHDAASQFAAAIVRLSRPRTKLIMTFHRSLAFESERTRDRVRNAFACWLSGAVVTASHERREHFLKENSVSNRKLFVIPLGIEIDLYARDPKRRCEIRQKLGIQPDTLLVGSVGHFGREKGIDIAVRAFGELRHRFPQLDVRLVILGEGTPKQRAHIERTIEDYADESVILAGHQAKVREWYSAMDLLLHTPRLEAFGLVLIEAMSASLPVVASRVGGVPEIVRHEETGILCKSESTSEMADALAQLVQSPELRDRFGARAAAIARSEYTSTLATERYLELYSQMVASRSLPAQSAVV